MTQVAEDNEHDITKDIFFNSHLETYKILLL